MTAPNQLDQLKQYTVVVADTGDFASMKQYAPREKPQNDNVVRVGSIDWILKGAARRAAAEKIAASAKGW